MKTIALIAASLLFSLGSIAQTRVVKGQLTTFNKYPVQNVEVSAKKAKSTVVTDSLGQFEIVSQSYFPAYHAKQGDSVRVGEISFINPCETAAIDVLKDEGAALYGASASNGVVVIETKEHQANSQELLPSRLKTLFCLLN